MTARLLGYADEPRESGAVVAVHYGDYRRQELWINSGSNVGNWYCLGGEYGRPKAWHDPRTEAEKMTHHPAIHGPPPRPGPDEVPLHPTWPDVLARGPATLLTGGDQETYLRGWRAGRMDLWQGLEDDVYDDPKEQT